MAGVIESAAVFEQRALATGLSQTELNATVAAGFSTMGRLAFACSYQPGAADETAFTALLASILGAPATGPQAACFRRLYFEAYTLSASDLRARLERTEETPARRLAVPERAHRYTTLQTRLVGLTLLGELEPSDDLVDICVAQYDDNRLGYVGWTECTKREQELAGLKKDPALK